MVLILSICLLTFLGLVENAQILMPPTATTAETFPYHAVIETDGWWCNGVIISETFVLTRASCIIENKKTMVYLGFTRNPFIPDNQKDPEGQVFHGINYYVHDEFGTILSNNQFINNLALIELHKPLKRTATVQPVAIASPEDYPIPPGTYVNVTGFLNHEDDGNIHYATVQMRDTDTCLLFYGDSFLKTQERCVRQRGLLRSRWQGPYVVDGILVGLQRSLHADAKCQVSTPPCDVHDVFFSLQSYLEWIFRYTTVAGVDALKYFKHDNPYWQYRPERIERESVQKVKETVIELEVSVQTCKQNENAFIKALKAAIDNNLEKGIKQVMFVIDLY